MRLDITNLRGQASDPAGWQLKPESFTTASNIRKSDGQFGTIGGHSVFFNGIDTPYFLMPVTDGTTYYWIYMGLDNGYLYDGSASYDITRASGVYTGTTSNRWNGCIINGVPVLNNGVDAPQMFTPILKTTDLQDLTAWGATWQAKVIRQYKNFLFALGVTKSSVDYKHMVKWSDVADSGTVPSTWDETVATNLAGETNLSDTDGIIIDAATLRDELIIYKEDSAFGCQYVGGTFVFRFRRIIGLSGILAQECAVEFDGGHFVVGGSSSRDIYIHDGQTSRSICEKRVRDTFYSDLDGDNYDKTFVINNKARNEIWVFYPSAGQTYPNKAFIWNYIDDDWYTRDLPSGTVHAALGIVDIGSYTWDTLPYDTWDDWPGSWNERSFSPSTETLVSASSTRVDIEAIGVSRGTSLVSGVANTIAGEAIGNASGSSTADADSGLITTYFFKYEDGYQFNGVNPTCLLERLSIDIGNTSDVHLVKNIYPYAEGSDFNVYVGSQMSPNDPVNWEGPYSFDPATGYKVDCRSTGRLHSIRFTSQSNTNWAISGYGIEYEFSGKR